MVRGISFSYRFIPVWIALAISPLRSGEAGAAPQAVSLQDSVLRVGEELTYNVRYAVLDIGQVRIRITDRIIRHDSVFYKAVAYIDSYQGIPFVDVHTRYESLFDTSAHSIWFESRTRDDSRSQGIEYTFSYPHRQVVITWNRGEGVPQKNPDTLGVDGPAEDGLSLLYFARTHLSSRQNMSVPAVVSEKKGNAHIRFTDERVAENIDAVPYPVDLLHFEGDADFIGVLGLTGEFEGWCSNDAAKVPVIATMKVMIGEVHIELIHWNREGWMPPRYTEGTEK